jgi:hypothetical protein
VDLSFARWNRFNLHLLDESQNIKYGNSTSIDMKDMRNKLTLGENEFRTYNQNGNIEQRLVILDELTRDSMIYKFDILNTSPRRTDGVSGIQNRDFQWFTLGMINRDDTLARSKLLLRRGMTNIGNFYMTYKNMRDVIYGYLSPRFNILQVVRYNVECITPGTLLPVTKYEFNFFREKGRQYVIELRNETSPFTKRIDNFGLYIEDGIPIDIDLSYKDMPISGDEEIDLS